MNGYGRLSEMQGQLAGVQSSQLVDTLLAFRDEASREFDRGTGRKAGFYTSVATRYFNGNGTRRLLLGVDLLSVTTLKVASSQDEADAGTFDYTLVDGTDYRLWPRNAGVEGQPYRAIDLLQSGSQIGGWLYGEGTIQIVGTWGYSEEWQATGLTGTLSTTSDLSIDASANAEGVIDPGDVLKLGSEQVGPISDVSATTVTIAAGGRGANGTTAATQTTQSIYIRRYPRDIERAVKERAVGLAWQSQSGYQGGAAFAGEASPSRETYARWMGAIRQYRDPAAVL